jgi:serine/threonine protein kinase
MSRVESSEGPPTGDTGTLWYAAPEQLEEGERHTTKTDVFSFGYLLYEIITGRAVFAPPDTPMSVLRRIRAGDFPTLPDGFGAFMQGLIRRCWSKNPRDRPSFAQILRQFEDCGFTILPGVNADAIREAVDEVVAWESRMTEYKP